MVKRILLDTDAVNRWTDAQNSTALMDLAQQANDQGAVEFIKVHVVEDQLRATSDPERRTALLATYAALPGECVATSGSVWGVSKWDAATWGDGGESGVSIPEVTTGGRGGLHDALIATTASARADVLVTNDRDLREKVERCSANCTVWDFGTLETILRGQARTA